MREYIIRRVILMVPTILIVALLIFSMVRMVPGDVLASRMMEGGLASQESIAKMRAELGLDKPFFTQFGTWMGGIVRGDLGNSLYTEQPIITEIKRRLPVSIELGAIAIMVTLSVATTIGVISALRQDSLIDYVARVTAIGWISVPSFWVGTLVIVLPVIWWGYMAPITYVPFFENPAQNLRQFLPPGIIMGLGSMGATLRLTRSSLLEVLRQDYIRTAWAKGLKERSVITRHALKNAIIPVVTLWGAYFEIMVGGAVIIENVFVLPGMGQLLVDSVTYRDYTQVQGLILIISATVLVLNLTVDLIYSWLDPRIKY